MCRKFFIFLLFLISYISIFPQSESAIPTLTLPVSPKSAGAGGTGTANIQSDAFGYWNNPAYLGYASERSFVSGGFYPGVIDWGGLNNYAISNYTINSYAISAGYNLQQQYDWLPVSIGVAYSGWQYNYGDIFGYSFGAKDKYNAYSFSLGLHTIVNISTGLTVKSINSVLEDTPGRRSETDLTALDYGILLNLPLNNFLNQPLKFNIDNKNSVYMDVDYNIGYSIQNVGDEIYYEDEAQKDPLPRTARLAHNINLSFRLHSEAINIKLLNLSYSIDAVDILVQKSPWDSVTSASKFDYQGLLGDIKPLKTLFLGKGDNHVLVRKGLEIELGEILYLSWGGFDGVLYPNMNTSGFGLKLTGLLKISNMLFPGTIISQLINKVDIQYNKAAYFDNSDLETNYQSIAVTISGF